MNEPALVKEGILRRTAAGDVLLGARCRQCGQTHFPATGLCFACLGEQLDAVELSRTGRLFAFTTVHLRSAHFQPPYSVGYVQLPEGIRVFAPLRFDDRPPRVDMPMTLEVVPLWVADGKDVLGYRFYPS